MSLHDEVRAVLDRAGIRHALIGGLALSRYGVNRATLDVDLLAADPASLSADLWKSLKDRGIEVESRLGDLPERCASLWRRIRAGVEE